MCVYKWKECEGRVNISLLRKRGKKYHTSSEDDDCRAGEEEEKQNRCRSRIGGEVGSC